MLCVDSILGGWCVFSRSLTLHAFILIINVYLSMSTQEYKGVAIKKLIHSKCN